MNMMKSSIVLAGAFAASIATAACPTGTTEVSENVCKVKGTYNTDLLLTNDNTYLLSGGVFIGNDEGQTGTLTIEAGTTIKGESGRDYLVISRGSKIIAEGEKTRQSYSLLTKSKEAAGVVL